VRSGACDDSNSCTIGDTCQTDGGCAGIGALCTPPGQCFQTAPNCQSDGGCLFTPRTGAACTDGGFCTDGGSCALPPPVFTFTPSNFTEAQLPGNAGAMIFNCLTTTATTGSSGVAWSNNCAGNPIPVAVPVTIGAQSAELILVDSLSIAFLSTLRVEGDRPLIIAVAKTATIDGTLSVRSQLGAIGGAGANQDCAVGLGDPGLDGGNPDTAGGGGGGAFGTDGTDGTNGAGGGVKGAKGMNFPGPTLIPLHGGCPGGNGGRRNAAFGAGGNGGGAIQISTAGVLTVSGSGVVTASGAGGTGGQHDDRTGGGGGGSGGAILLEGLTVVLNAGAWLTANGGGGGQGSGTGMFFNGADGTDGFATSANRAPGGVSIAYGGAGGNGAAKAGNAQAAGAPTGGTNSPGGGGGGGVGRIRLHGVNGCTVTTTNISPDQTGVGTGCP
jgi:hypothetical protein